MRSGMYATAQGYDDSLVFTGDSKTYYMAKQHGLANIVVDSFYKQGIEVYYAPTGERHKWSWANRNKGWDWANERRQHLGFAISGGVYANRR